MNISFISIRAKAPIKKINVENPPTMLYHASPLTGLSTLIPQSKTIRDEEEGPVVFATPDFSYATMFLVQTDDSWVRIGAFNTVYYIVISDRKKFEKLDRGGTIYSLPVDDFYCDLNKSGREKEWVCKKPVSTINTTTFTSSLFAMMEHRVQVYFVSKNIFNKIVLSKDHGHAILKDEKSENFERNVNPISL